MELVVKILSIIFIHWVADFVLQFPKMKTKKSTNLFWLFTHILVYSTTWLFIGFFIFKPDQVLLFTTVTFVLHFITDFLTSRWTAYLYKKDNIHGSFGLMTIVGLDQFLHYAQLFITYQLIFGI